MSEIKALTHKEAIELDELLKVADSVLGTSLPVIKGNPKAATIVGKAIGGPAGAAIASSAGALGLVGALGVTGGVLGLGIVSVVALPATIVLLIGAGIGLLFNRNEVKKKEQQRQANYCKDLAEKQQKIYEKYETLKREHARTDKGKNDIIKKQQEKIAEYEVMFEALKKKREEVEGNLVVA